MRRRKRLSIFRIALALAVTAALVPAAAQAKGMPIDFDKEPATLSPDDRNLYRGSEAHDQQVVVPYLSQGKGVEESNLGGATLSPDDRNLLRGSEAHEQQVVVPYLSQGQNVNSAELGYAAGNAADDRVFSRDARLETTPAADDGGSTIDVSPYAVTGFGIGMLLAMGIGFGIWHSRRTRLSPA